MKNLDLSKAMEVVKRPMPLALAAMFGAALMATYNYKGGYSAGTNRGMQAQPGSFNVVDIKLDFAAIAAARSAAGQAALAATDVMEVVPVRAGTWVPAVFVDCTTAEGAAATIDVGDGAAANGFLDDFSLNAVAWGSSLITTSYSLATAGGKLYTADDTIDVLVNSNNVDVAVMHLVIPMVDMRLYRS